MSTDEELISEYLARNGARKFDVKTTGDLELMRGVLSQNLPGFVDEHAGRCPVYMGKRLNAKSLRKLYDDYLRGTGNEPIHK